MLLTTIRYRLSKFVRGINRVRYRILGVEVGKDVFISWGAFIDTAYPGSIKIGNGSYITRGVYLVAHNHAVYNRISSSIDDGKGFIEIGNNVFIGVGAIILRNVKIGDNSVIGAGAVVNLCVPENSLAMGNPARIRKIELLQSDKND